MLQGSPGNHEDVAILHRLFGPQEIMKKETKKSIAGFVWFWFYWQHRYLEKKDLAAQAEIFKALAEDTWKLQ